MCVGGVSVGGGVCVGCVGGVCVGGEVSVGCVWCVCVCVCVCVFHVKSSNSIIIPAFL